MTIHSVEATITEAALSLSGVSFLVKAVGLDLLGLIEELKLRRLRVKAALAKARKGEVE